jgi:5-methylcytosine-specific restriction endonuclease McrA
MAFSELVRDQAYWRSGGRCECARLHPLALYPPHRGGRCSRTFARHGGQWEAHHRLSVAAGGSDTLANCEVLCVACHQLTASYGG